jgi:hypothetical protein
MNKETKLQFVQLFTEIADVTGVDETPTYDELNFTPIMSPRTTHTEAVLALGADISTALADADEKTAPLTA